MTKSDQNEKLAEILATLVEDYLADLERGEDPDISEIAQRYPEYADRIVSTLGMLRTLEELTPDDLASSADKEPQKVIGDFELVRELGRGGMGIVYEAIQVAVDRRVALKVLPFAALADSSRLRRFKNEVRAAGSLHHPNIVPVFAVGVQRGCHYFAMQFIDGMSLAEVVSELRRTGKRVGREELARVSGDDSASDGHVDKTNPKRQADSNSATVLERTGASPHAPSRMNPDQSTRAEIQSRLSTVRSASPREFQRTVTRWGIQVADALSFAHQGGILHRDIKPGNLLLDGDGKVWVADFGLARIQQDATLTLTGDMLGTLRYMAPEQLKTERGLIDHRSDIYSLGATLYELVCLQPVFQATDREQLLHLLLHEQPTPPRKINPKIAPELETIILKALAKEPEDRFGTAEELRDDLQRFLDQKPIHSHPPGSFERVINWFRRHPGLTATVSAAMFVLLMISAGFMVALNRQQEATLRQRDQARKERDEADRQQNIAAVERDKAKQDRDRAREALQVAITTLDEFFGEIGKDWISEDRALSDFQSKILYRSAELLPVIAENLPKDEDYDWAAGLAFKRAGNALLRVREFAGAGEHYTLARQLLSQTLDRNYEVKKVRFELAAIDDQLGRVALSLGDYTAATQQFAKSRQQWRSMASDYANDRSMAPLYVVRAVKSEYEELRLASYQLQDEQLLERIDALLAELTPIRKIREHDYQDEALLMVKLMQLQGAALRRLGRFQEAKQACNASSASLYLSTRLDLRGSRHAMAALSLELALIQMELGEQDEALENLENARQQLRDSFLFDGTPKEIYLSKMSQGQGTHLAEPHAYTLYARIQSRLAQLKSHIGETDQAKGLMDEATRTCHFEFLACDQQVFEFAYDLLFCVEALPHLRPLTDPRYLRSFDVCLQSIKAVEDAGQLAPLHQSGRAMILAGKGQYWQAQQRHQDALELFERALEMQRRVQDQVGSHPLVQKRLDILQKMLDEQHSLVDRVTGSNVRELEFAGSYLTEKQRQEVVSPRGLIRGPEDDDPAIADQLLVVDGKDKRIMRYETSGDGGEVFVPPGTGGLTGTYAATFGPDQNLYIADAAAKLVMRFGGRTGEPLGVDSAPAEKSATYIASGAGGLQQPRYMTFNAEGDMFIMSLGTTDAGVSLAEVLQFYGPSSDDPGRFVRKFVGPESGLMNPNYLAFGPDQHLYVADGSTNSIHRFDGETGQALPAPGRSNADLVPSGLGGLSRPYTFRFSDVVGNARPELLVISSTGEVLCYDSQTGDFRGVYASFEGSPMDLEITPNGELLIAVAGGRGQSGDILRFRGP